MRQLNWDEPLSEEDKTWARQAGLPMVEDRIRENETRFGEESSADAGAGVDRTTKSALDPTATASEGPVPTGNTPVQEVVEPDDDYDDWSVKELEAEVAKRNDEAETEEDLVMVTGTGKNNAVRKPDLIAGLRAWDRTHDTE